LTPFKSGTGINYNYPERNPFFMGIDQDFLDQIASKNKVNIVFEK